MMTKNCALVVTLVGAMLGSATGAPVLAERQMEGRVDAIDGIVASQFHAPQGGVVWSAPGLGHADARYQRIHLSEIAGVDAARPFVIEIRDDQDDVVETLSWETLATTSEVWSGVVQGGLVGVRVVAPSPPTGLHFRIDKLAWGQEPGAPLSIIGRDRREQLYEVHDPAILRAAEAVAKLSLIVDGGLASCTGFLISPRRMLTNEHCIDSQAICDSAVAIFGFQRKNAQTILPGKSVRCSRFVKADHELDFAVIDLEGTPGDEHGWLTLAPRPVSVGERLVLIQHPGGDPKDISRDGCKVKTKEVPGVSPALTDFGHVCDTKGGSSGSPVVDRNMQVVGLHHYARAATGEPFDDQNRAVRVEKLRPTLPVEDEAPGGGQ